MSRPVQTPFFYNVHYCWFTSEISSLKMAMAAIDRALLANKFRGCLIGSLMGDCLGAPYENEDSPSKVVLQNDLDKLEGKYFKAPVKQYTDDTAMTKSVAESLIDCKGFNAKDLAKRFVVEYFREPRRGYGEGVVEVFYKLRTQKLKDPLGPAREQFEGTGSYGNGGAMRISPVSLFYHCNYMEMIDVARQVTAITHTHKQGIDGALLQAIAIHQGLLMDPNVPLDVQDFTQKLISKMAQIEKDEEGLGLDNPTPFQKQLEEVQRLLNLPEGARDDQVQDILGTRVVAKFSVPTAIYCFLRAHQQIPHINTDNPFRRAIQYAISLGGDTDTIASMAGSIAGAFHGDSIIPKNMQKHCEYIDNAVTLADSLFEVSSCRE